MPVYPGALPGTFYSLSIRGIPPGKYLLAALETTEEDLNSLDPQSLGRILKQGQSIQIDADETVRPQLKLVPAPQVAAVN